MADTIGTIYFAGGPNGVVPVAGTMVADITRPAVDGGAYLKLGSRAAPGELSGTVITSGNTQTMLTGLMALKSTVVDIVYRGQTYSNYLILDVVPGEVRAFNTGVGGVNYLGVAWVAGTNGHRCRVTFVVTPAGT